MPPEREMFPVVYPIGEEPEDPSQPPNVPAAEAEEARLLAEIAAFHPTEPHSDLLARLHRPFSRIMATGNARLSDLLTRYFAARHRTRLERRRQAIADDAAHPGTTAVTLTLAAPMGDSYATIIRQSWSVPFNVILLGPEATAETLAAALGALEVSRARDGAVVTGSHVIDLRGMPWVPTLAARKAEMERLLQQLREAPVRRIDGVGSARGIEFRTQPISQ